MERLILGSLEEVSIPSLGVFNILAKVDTGAFSGALHCTDIMVERQDEQELLSFTPLGNPDLTTRTTEFKKAIVRSAHGHEVVRYLLPVTIEVRGKTYTTCIGLSDRTMMKRDILLGRRFLLEQDAMVDVSLTKSLDDEAERLE